MCNDGKWLQSKIKYIIWSKSAIPFEKEIEKGNFASDAHIYYTLQENARGVRLCYKSPDNAYTYKFIELMFRIVYAHVSTTNIYYTYAIIIDNKVLHRTTRAISNFVIGHVSLTSESIKI